MRLFNLSIPSWSVAIAISGGVAGSLFLLAGQHPRDAAAVGIGLFLIFIYPKQMMAIAAGVLTIRFWPISIPFVAVGGAILYWLKRKKETAEEDDVEVEFRTTYQEEITLREKQ